MCYFYNITQECDKPGYNVNFIIPSGDEGIISRCFITWQNLRIRANRRTPVRLFAAVRTPAPGFESILSNTIKNHARWACFLLWRRRRIPSHGTVCRLWGNRNDLTALYLSNLLVVEPAICDFVMDSHRFISLGIIKMPCAGIFIIPGGAKNLLPLAYERPVP